MRKIACLVFLVAISSLCACKTTKDKIEKGDVQYYYMHDSKSCVAVVEGDNSHDGIVAWSVPCENVIDRLSVSNRKQMLEDIKKMSAETEEFCVHPQPPVPIGQ